MQLFLKPALYRNLPAHVAWGLPDLIRLGSSPSNFLSPVSSCSLLWPWASFFIATLVSCQNGIHPLFLTVYPNLPTLINFEEAEEGVFNIELQTVDHDNPLFLEVLW